MYSAKPNPLYYREILSDIEIDASRAIMVGDNWENDIVPAKSVGLFTYWIIDDSLDLSHHSNEDDGFGTLEDFYDRLSSGWLLS